MARIHRCFKRQISSQLLTQNFCWQCLTFIMNQFWWIFENFTFQFSTSHHLSIFCGSNPTVKMNWTWTRTIIQQKQTKSHICITSMRSRPSWKWWLMWRRAGIPSDNTSGRVCPRSTSMIFCKGMTTTPRRTLTTQFLRSWYTSSARSWSSLSLLILCKISKMMVSFSTNSKDRTNCWPNSSARLLLDKKMRISEKLFSSEILRSNLKSLIPESEIFLKLSWSRTVNNTFSKLISMEWINLFMHIKGTFINHKIISFNKWLGLVNRFIPKYQGSMRFFTKVWKTSATDKKMKLISIQCLMSGYWRCQLLIQNNKL